MTAPDFPIRVGLNRVLGFLLLVAGAGNLAAMYVTGQALHLLLAAVLGVNGLLWLFGNLIVVHADRVQVNIMGLPLRAYPIASLADLQLDARRLYLDREGQWLPISYLGFSAARADVEKLRAAVAATPRRR